jgi:hypothetical protein
MDARILKETLKVANGGRVECTVLAGNRLVRGIIENTFFEDVLGRSNVPAPQKLALSNDNLRYLEQMANRQLDAGEQEVVIIR